MGLADPCPKRKQNTKKNEAKTKTKDQKWNEESEVSSGKISNLCIFNLQLWRHYLYHLHLSMNTSLSYWGSSNPNLLFVYMGFFLSLNQKKMLWMKCISSHLKLSRNPIYSDSTGTNPKLLLFIFQFKEDHFVGEELFLRYTSSTFSYYL